MDLLPPRREEIQDQSRDRQRSEGKGIEQESTRDYLLSSRSSSRSGILRPPVNRIRKRQELHWIVARVVGSKEPARRKMRFFTAGRGLVASKLRHQIVEAAEVSLWQRF